MTRNHPLVLKLTTTVSVLIASLAVVTHQQTNAIIYTHNVGCKPEYAKFILDADHIFIGCDISTKTKKVMLLNPARSSIGGTL